MNEKIILIGGSGGVGKTTLSASIAIKLALDGHRTAVLTVDPAKRLAQTLGFKDFNFDLQPVPLPAGTKGSLHAALLDTKRSFDKIVYRFAQSEEQRQKILSNPLYQAMVKNLSGTHEYAAMEKLLEFSQNKDFDRIVVDTPPTQNALDLLSAPERLADFMDNSVLRWFQGEKPMYLRLFQAGTKAAMKILQKVFGSDFLKIFGDLMDAIDGMQAGFRKRNLEVLELLQSSDTAFLMATIATKEHLVEASQFSKTLTEKKIKLKEIIINRTYIEIGDLVSEESDRNTINQITPWLGYYRSLYLNQRKWVDGFKKQFQNLPIKEIPIQPSPPSDLISLSKLGELLVS